MPLYWKFKSWINNKLIHPILKLTYNFHLKISNLKQDANLFFKMSGNIPLRVIILLTVAVWFFVYHIFEQKFTIIDSHYNQILYALLGVSGVLIGMLYTGVLSVKNSLYKELPDIAKQSIYELNPISLIITYFTGLVSVCVSLLLLGVFQMESTWIKTFIIGIVWFFVLIIWITTKIGFHLFDDLSIISFRLFEKMKNEIKISVHSKNKNFHNICRNNITKHLIVVGSFKDFMSKSKFLKSSSFVKFSKDAIEFLNFYLDIKKLIPQNSYFHPDENIYTRLHESSSLYPIELAYPKKRKGHLEIEENLASIIKECIKANFKVKNYTAIIACLSLLVPKERVRGTFSKLISEHQETSFALKFYKEIGNIIFSKENLSNIKNGDEKYFLSIVDIYNLIYVKIILSEIEMVKIQDDIFYSKKKFKKIKWKNILSVYQARFSYFLHNLIQDAFTKINFEIQVEGKKITPNYYIENAIERNCKEKVLKDIQEILLFFDKNLKFFLSNGKIYIFFQENKEKYLILSMIYNRFFECIEKFNILIEALKAEKNLSLKDENFDDFEKRIKILHESLLKQLPHILQKIPADTPSYYPDIFGKFFNLLTENMFQKLILNEPIQKEEYISFFSSCLKIIDNIFKRENTKLSDQVHYASNIGMELFALNGYIFIMSEYHQQIALWDMVRNYWDTYLKTNPNQIKFLHHLYTFSKNNYFIIPSYNYLQSALRSFCYKLEKKLNIKREKDMLFSNSGKATNINHSSKYIRAFFKKNLTREYFEGHDVFVNVYLLDKFKEYGLDISERDKEFSKNVKDEDNNVE